MPDLRDQLRDLGRLLRLTAALRGLLRWLLVGGLLGGGLALAARLGAPAWVLPASLTLAAIALVACLLGPLTQDLRRRQVALLIERHDPALRELVLSATELAEASPPQRHYSPQLTSVVIAQAAQAVAAVPRAELAQARRLRPLALLATISLACGLSLTVLYRDSLADMLQVAGELPAVVRLPTKALPVRPEPVLSGVRLQITPPPYTGLPARTLDAGLGTVKVPSGSRLSLSAAVPAIGLLSLRVGKSACKLSLAGDRAAYAFTLATSTTWQLAVRDGVHTTSRQGRLQALVDQRPTVRLTYPRRDLTLDTLKPVKLAALASDDYGLTELALEYLAPGQKQWQQVQLGASGRIQRVEYEWDLSPLNLQGGQGLSYRFRVRDNNLFTGPQASYSETFRITLADVRPKEAQKRLEAASEQQGDALQKLRDQAEQVQQQLQALEQDMQQGRQAELTPQQRAELQQAAAQLQKQADTLREALAQTAQEVQQSGQSSPELSRKLEEINRLLNETLDKQLKQAIQQLQQAAEAATPENLPQTLEQAQKAQQELMQRLDQMLALLQQAKLEGALAALRQEVEKLAARQQELIGQGQKQGDFERQARDQKTLGRDTDRVPEKVERLAEEVARAEASETKDLAAKLQKIAESVRQSDPAGQMQQAAQSLRASQPQQAASPQQQALQTLQKAAADLAEAQADVYSQQRQELQQATAELVLSGLYLSRQQEALRDQTQPYEGSLPEQMMSAKATLQQFTRRQQAITAGSGRVARRLAELAGKSPVVDPGLAQQAAGVGQLSLQAERDLGGGAMEAALQSQEAVTIGLNQLVAELLQSDEQFQQASAQMALQEYMKRLQQMAGQQRGLNQRTQQMGGGAPQPKPGQRPGGEQSGGMSGLAGQQLALRQALQKMLGQAGNQGGLGDQLGGVPGEMDEVEKDLRGENVTRETYRRQQDIVHKMLDAQRSLYQKDREERQRKAEAPKPYQRASSPPALRQAPTQKPPPPALNAPRQDLPLGYEDLTRQYFEALGRQ